MWAASQAGKAELAEVGVADVERMMIYGTTRFGLGTLETVVTGALAGTNTGIGMNLYSRTYRIACAQTAHWAQISTPRLTLKKQAE